MCYSCIKLVTLLSDSVLLQVHSKNKTCSDIHRLRQSSVTINKFECCLSARMHPASSAAQVLDSIWDQKPIEEKNAFKIIFNICCYIVFHVTVVAHFIIFPFHTTSFLLPIYGIDIFLCFPLLPRTKRALKKVITIFLLVDTSAYGSDLHFQCLHLPEYVCSCQKTRSTHSQDEQS